MYVLCVCVLCVCVSFVCVCVCVVCVCVPVVHTVATSNLELYITMIMIQVIEMIQVIVIE